MRSILVSFLASCIVPCLAAGVLSAPAVAATVSTGGAIPAGATPAGATPPGGTPTRGTPTRGTPTRGTPVGETPAAGPQGQGGQDDPGNDRLPTTAAFAEGRQRRAGFLPLIRDARKGGVFLEIPSGLLGAEFLYATALAGGLGSNPIGLDRGSLGPQHLVEFERRGPRILAIANNTRYRARSLDPREVAAVEQSFARSVLASLEIVAEDRDGRVVVDAAPLLLRDAVDAAGRMQRAGDEGYRFDPDRSVVDHDASRAFPDNTEVRVLVTLAADRAGAEARRVAADGRIVSLGQHHSFVRLPETPWRARRADPRVGYFTTRFADYATAIDEPLEVEWIRRHRLEKRDPQAGSSPVVEPIVYYVDPGTPEPVRAALIEGASWWADAFAAAGFEDAFRVELLPEDADPMDIRYHVIHWVHRRTRGWSYGQSVTDPRSGEILKGSVLLGSLRVRQDLLLLQSLDVPADGCCAGLSPDASHLLPAADPIARETALARIRQLAAHEVGHTLGLSHNFAASGYGRASVMDYPAPWIRVGEDGELDLSAAYDTGIGEYDAWAIRYGYGTPGPERDEEAFLAAVLEEGLDKGYLFLSDQDARSAASAHPHAALWDNGADPVAELAEVLRVRDVGLRGFGPDRLRPGQPLAELAAVMVPLHLHHRFQLEAAAKVIGGVDYRHSVPGDGQPEPRPAEGQAAALTAVLGCLAPDVVLPEVLADRATLLPPLPPSGSPDTLELVESRAGPGSGAPEALARVAAESVVSLLLQRQRLARLLAVDGDLSAARVLDELLDTAFPGIRSGAAPAADRPRAREAIQIATVDGVIGLLRDTRAVAPARALARDRLHGLRLRMYDAAWGAPGGEATRLQAHLRLLDDRMRRALEEPFRETMTTPGPATPPGAPIGNKASRKTGSESCALGSSGTRSPRDRV